MGDRVALDIEPAPATLGMNPPLTMKPLGVAAHEEIVGPFLVGERGGIERPRYVRLAAVMELGLVARAAPGAGDEQHLASGQCATAAAPCSSMRWPETKRSSAK